MTDRHFYTDTAVGSLSYAGEGEVPEDFEDADFDATDLDTVTLDGPWTDFFGTDTFVQFDATVAQPITQPYIHDGKLKRFRKDELELKRAQAQIDNLPWTMGHPPHDRVTSSEQIRGFWNEPRWNDGQDATLNVPVTDHEAVRFALTHEEVSIGFSGDLDWSDDEADAAQRNMAYDHIASVDGGRCPPDKGCGLHNDDTEGLDEHGHVVDSVRSESTEEGDVSGSSQWSIGDWVSFVMGGERVHGKVRYVTDSLRESASRDDSSAKNREMDSERALVALYDEDEQALSDESTTVATSSLNEWVGPHVDSCPGDVCHCGCHTDDPAQPDEQHSDTEHMTDSLEDFIDEHDPNAEDVIDALDIDVEQFADVPDEPTDFYDDEPEVETLADDFPTVQMLVDEKEDIEGRVEDLTDELRESKRETFEEKVEELTEATDAWGDEDELLEQFEDGEIGVGDVEQYIDRTYDIRGEDTTTVADSSPSNNENTLLADNDGTVEDPDIDRTQGGRYDLRSWK